MTNKNSEKTETKSAKAVWRGTQKTEEKGVESDQCKNATTKDPQRL